MLNRYDVLSDVTMYTFFFFKQKTAYEMRISDWSSDVCSSDLSVQNQTQVYDKLEAYSRDQQPATMRVSVSFHIPDSQVEALYAQYGSIDVLIERLVSRKLPDELKNVFGGYNASSVIQDRTRFGIDVTK